MIENLPDGQGIWHFDFKQNVGIPQGAILITPPRQPGTDD